MVARKMALRAVEGVSEGVMAIAMVTWRLVFAPFSA